MTIAHRCLDEMHVEATGRRDRHQGIAARDTHRDRLENLAGIDAERPRLGDRGVGLLVRDGLEWDAMGFEMLRYLPHHPTPHLAREPSITRIRPRDPWRLSARRGRPAAAAFFGCLYYAALRPAEAVALRVGDCVLPAKGWGRIDLATSGPRARTEWTDTGASHEHCGLKHRADKETRSIPIPPVLVAMLRGHIARYETGPGGRPFRTNRGGLLNDTGYGEIWQGTRTLTPHPAQHTSRWPAAAPTTCATPPSYGPAGAGRPNALTTPAVAARIRQLAAQAEHRRAIAEFHARRAADQQARIGELLLEAIATQASLFSEPDRTSNHPA
jgi:hypothetical protein